MVETKPIPNFRKLIHDLAESSAFHGISKIANSKTIFLKFLWLTALFAATGVSLYQLWKLFDLYGSSPVSTTVKLEFNELPFPAVSFCNMNPVKLSKRKDLPEILQLILNNGDSKGETNISETEWWDIFNGVEDYAGSGDHAENLNVQGDYYYQNLLDDLQDQPATDHDPIPTEVSGVKDKWIEGIEHFKMLFRSQEPYDRYFQGHTIDDMLISCSFGSMECYPSNFTHFHSSEYGNCYTFDTNGLISRRPGPLYGLVLTLNIEKPEYIDFYTTNYGVKLVIHEPGTQALPSDEGFTLGTSRETNIGLKMIKISRLGPPYGTCNNGEMFRKAHDVTFTQKTCLKICKYNFITEECGCKPMDVEITIADDEELEFCSESIEWEHECVKKRERKINQGIHKCDCSSSCREIVYDKTLSAITWPGDKYWENVLVPRLCQKNLTYTNDTCSRLNNFNEQDTALLDDTFLRVNIYYENLNFEHIIEEPVYDEFRFMSDIGGTLGLYIGASLLSFFELVQLIIEICMFLWKRMHKKKSASTIYVAEKTSDAPWHTDEKRP